MLKARASMRNKNRPWRRCFFSGGLVRGGYLEDHSHLVSVVSCCDQVINGVQPPELTTYPKWGPILQVISYPWLHWQKRYRLLPGPGEVNFCPEVLFYSKRDGNL